MLSAETVVVSSPESIAYTGDGIYGNKSENARNKLHNRFANKLLFFKARLHLPRNLPRSNNPKKLTFQDSRAIKNNPSTQTNWAEGLRYSTSVNYDKNQAVTRGVVVVHSETVNS